VDAREYTRVGKNVVFQEKSFCIKMQKHVFFEFKGNYGMRKANKFAQISQNA
jgi:hypothetical protein